MEDLSHKRKITVMTAVIAAMFFAAINQTIVSTALPKIIATLGGMDYYTWVITIYLLTSTVSTALVGKLSDIYGRKPFILAGIVIFMIGALLTGFSQDIYQMITFRGIQGVGAGIIMSAVFSAIGDLFAPRERGKWTGVMMAVFGFSSVIGPTLGGWIVDHMAWEWVFWIFLPVGVAAFFMIMFLFPKVERKQGERIDYAGSLLLTLTIVPLLMGFSWAGTKYDWGSAQIVGLFGAAVVCGILFVLVERKATSPVLPLWLFGNGVVTISNAIGFLQNAGMMGALFYLSFYVQGVEAVRPTYAGYVTMPMSISMVVLSAIAGRWISNSGKYKRYALAGVLIMVAGMLIMAFMNNIPLAVVAMIVFGTGLGLSMPVFSLTVQNAVSPADIGVATASSQLFRNLGGTIGVAVMGTIMATSLTNALKEKMAAGHFDASELDPAVAEKLQGAANPQMLLDQTKLDAVHETLPKDVQPLFEGVVVIAREALATALSHVFLTGTALLVVAFVLTLFLKEIPLRTSNRMPATTGANAAAVNETAADAAAGLGARQAQADKKK